MTLSNFITMLQQLEHQGHGALQIYYRHGASGECGELSHAFITDRVDDTGPFDTDGAPYVSIYAGN
jgi:hypothetical protein